MTTHEAPPDAVDPLDRLRTQATIPLWPEAGKLLGLSKNATYKAASHGELPVLRIGGRLLVPCAKLRAMVGIDA